MSIHRTIPKYNPPGVRVACYLGPTNLVGGHASSGVVLSILIFMEIDHGLSSIDN
jgi:hypothetical protein